jgi:hypothetical protein
MMDELVPIAFVALAREAGMEARVIIEQDRSVWSRSRVRSICGGVERPARKTADAPFEMVACDDEPGIEEWWSVRDTASGYRLLMLKRDFEAYLARVKNFINENESD